VKFKEFKQLDGTIKNQIDHAGSGRFLRRFAKTPFPIADTDVACPHFMLLAWANGCPFNCAWCYLKGTFRFYGQKENGRVPSRIKDRAEIKKELDEFLKAKLPAELINTGELSDSLMDEAGSLPFSEWLLQQIQNSHHKILFLTKSTNIQNFLRHDWTKHAVLSWSLNAPAVAERWEKYAPPVYQRLEAAKKVYDAGYEVRFRIDPMVPIEDWQTHYAGLVEAIFAVMRPTRLTLGCLRGLTTTIIYCKDKSWVPYLTEKSNWGKKPPFKQRQEMYQFIIDRVPLETKVGICKETLGMWKALDMEPQNMKCNCLM
jgi:spore photoproduct lyase